MKKISYKFEHVYGSFSMVFYWKVENQLIGQKDQSFPLEFCT